jgi:hypothetical protein
MMVDQENYIASADQLFLLRIPPPKICTIFSKPMRAIIATDFASQLRKLLWITENNSGVSAGIYDKEADPHATYHVDGTHHFKVKRAGRTHTLKKKKRLLTSIDTEEGVLNTSAYYTENVMKRLPKFTSDERADILIVIGRSVFHDIGSASFEFSIIHRSYEPQFIREAYSSYQHQNFILISVNVFALQRFTSHKVGVLIYKGRKWDHPHLAKTTLVT